MWSSAGGVTRVTDEIGSGCDETIAAMRLVRLSPLKARWPVAISYRSAPSAKMSVRASASAPSSCSGAMYWKVPRIVPSVVSGRASVGISVSPFTGAASETCASPKSSSFAPDFVRMTLPGFRSR
jgi:hypothetical protein